MKSFLEGWSLTVVVSFILMFSNFLIKNVGLHLDTGSGLSKPGSGPRLSKMPGSGSELSESGYEKLQTT
jgi:hypothetical protein